MQSTILDWPELLTIRDRAKSERKRLVWTNGCFDLLHVGHVRSLQAARRLGDLLVVGLNSDESVRQLKGVGRPVVPAIERAEILSALGCVDYVVVFNELIPVCAVAQLQPDICCKGSEYRPPNGKPIPEAEIVMAYGGRMEFLPMVPATSTTTVIDRIRSGQGNCLSGN